MRDRLRRQIPDVIGLLESTQTLKLRNKKPKTLAKRNGRQQRLSAPGQNGILAPPQHPSNTLDQIGHRPPPQSRPGRMSQPPPPAYPLGPVYPPSTSSSTPSTQHGYTPAREAQLAGPLMSMCSTTATTFAADSFSDFEGPISEFAGAGDLEETRVYTRTELLRHRPHSDLAVLAPRPHPSPPVKERDERSCAICYDDEEPMMALVPCGHVPACIKCSPNLTSCPLCRKPVTNRIQLYFLG
eukprot:GHVO01029661.1.p1 GENE.GHVO01029661.1~~GHVO01029661.1.p1  ORF type:complete len:249 (-),score=46.29 GHVO01029661.1:235-957(-)